MYKLNKILWPTDGSDESLNALKFAKMMSKKFHANIKGYYVVTNLNYRKFNMLNMNINFDEFYNNEKNRAIRKSG
jgi:nucleotide-binding universal stress UspA family protein